MTRGLSRHRVGAILDRPVPDALRRGLTLRKEAFAPSRRVLDIGAGDTCRGSIGLDLRPATGVDVIGNGLELPFQNGVFDAVICYHLMEHLTPEQNQALLAEVARVLAPSGRAHLLCDRDVDRATLLEKDRTHVGRYEPHLVRRLAAEYLSIEVFQTHNITGNLNKALTSPEPTIQTFRRLYPAGTKVYIEGTPK